jgi:hypothetical protein
MARESASGRPAPPLGEGGVWRCGGESRPVADLAEARSLCRIRWRGPYVSDNRFPLVRDLEFWS